MKTTKTSQLSRILAVAFVVCLMVTMLMPISAQAANDAVNDCRYGVLQVNLIYTDDTNRAVTVNGGTGFLINDNTLLTSHHVVSLSTSNVEALATTYGKSVQEIQSRLSCTVTVSRDVSIPASILTSSFDMDFAVLRLSNSLQGKSPLSIRSSAEVQQTETVFAIGFPDTSALLQSYNTYTSADATITQGVVNKIGIGTNLYSGANTNYIQTSCNLDYGNSGGPMVDENGCVIGISQGFIGDSATEYFNAVAIDQVTEVLDALGIIYTKCSHADTPPETTEAPAPQATQPAPQATQPAPQATQPPATLPPITTQPEPADNSMFLILGIAAAVIVVIVIVVVVVLMSGKKSTPAVPVPTPAAPPVRPGTPPVNTGFAPPPTAPVQGAGETTVLSQGAGETTVLSRNAVSGGSLIRKRSGETISINAEQFVIGRERKGVNYCISDNSSISRNHVRLTVRNGATYLTDLNTANGTFVNGVKVMPRQEIALKNGDKITLADEDLEYRN